MLRLVSALHNLPPHMHLITAILTWVWPAKYEIRQATLQPSAKHPLPEASGTQQAAGRRQKAAGSRQQAAERAAAAAIAAAATTAAAAAAAFTSSSLSND